MRLTAACPIGQTRVIDVPNRKINGKALGKRSVQPSRTVGRLPPLNPLRVFEAAARHGNFTRAAAELHITQGAVSQSVRVLEDHLGHSLFHRTASGLHLTPEGGVYARTVGAALRHIADATSEFIDSRHIGVVTIRAYTSFLAHWLIPRIPDFHIRHPDVEVRFIAANDRVRVDHENVDLRVRYGHGRWSGTESALLLRDQLVPVISPKLLAMGGAPYPVDLLARFTWLHSSQRRADWRDWLRAADAPDMTPSFDMVVEELSVVYRLAVSGAGVALGNRHYLQEELSSHRLFEPVTPILKREAGYFLLWSSQRPMTGAALLLREWMRQTSADSTSGSKSKSENVTA
jgi:LysR family glycine cleavage system transcriptional activator